MKTNVKDCKLFKSTKEQFKLSLDGFTYNMLSKNNLGHVKSEKRNRATPRPVPLPN
jgi:hypothetical protein